MEDPNLPFTKSNSSQEPFSPSEESGWTSYFEDFLASEKRKTEETSNYTNISVSSSLVSDASWKPQVCSQQLNSCNKLNLMKMKKKKKTKIVFDDDSLEDTATSPVNSPKEKMADDGEGKNLAKGTTEETSYMGRVTECSELRKKGLCLVPFSMFVNNI
ncbi:vascular-related unknown protein 1-like [Dendrobium catenatum]|uniref:Uncharacterized protein n=1 Tax=Dendrobium catenatum TaxID=906689 RepID=A0A2I0WMQ1_9ASPA|nr:vascular-related unknown protein 1-like [Dendrobium catenatum]PKU76926.1 hypothetical protein MA16_Dca001532 [Dendrobium catenatum]